MGAELTGSKDILLVDDDKQDVELALSALEEGHMATRVAVVSDGAEALDYLCRRGMYKARSKGNPIVVLLDLKMPKVNGLEVLEFIKCDPYLKVIPVVMLSSSREERDLMECYNSGGNAFVVKPVDFAEFKNAVKQIGIFWTQINEPPPTAEIAETPAQIGKCTSPERREAGIENPTSHPAPGG